MTLRRFVITAVTLATLAGAAGCKSSKPVPCAQDGTCADGLACLGTVCAQPKPLNACQAGTDCGRAAPNEACVLLDGAPVEAAICARRCAADTDCSAGETCAPGTTVDGAAQRGCLPSCRLGATVCASAYDAPPLSCREIAGGGARCTPGAPPTPTWSLVSGGFASAAGGPATGDWRVVEAWFETSGASCLSGTCVEGGFTP
jgi:hypothetical protein